MASLIAVGTTQADSADFSLASGTSATLFLVDSVMQSLLPNNLDALIQIKSAGATYKTIGSLTSANPVLVLACVGTFRVRKSASVAPFGVDQN